MSLRRLFVVFACLAIWNVSSAKVSADLLTNGGFESLLEYADPTAPNWFAFFGAGSDGTFSTADPGYTGTIDPTEGSHHLSISNNGTPGGFSGVFQRVAAAPLQEYTFSFDARSNSGPTFPIGAEYRFEFLDAGGGVIGATGNIAIAGTLSDQYQPFSITATTVPGTVFIAPVIAVETFSASGSPGNLFVDNAVLTTIPEPTAAALFGLGGLMMVIRRRR